MKVKFPTLHNFAHWDHRKNYRGFWRRKRSKLATVCWMMNFPPKSCGLCQPLLRVLQKLRYSTHNERSVYIRIHS